MKRTLCSALIAGLFASQAYAAAPGATTPSTAPSAASAASSASGVDKAAVDAAVRPQDDFFRYSQGGWLKGTSRSPTTVRAGAPSTSPRTTSKARSAP
jgi:putative endopeptidase